MARTWDCRFERTFEEEMSSEGLRDVINIGSTRSRRVGDERRVRFVKCRVSRRITAKKETIGVFDIEVVSFEAVKVEDNDREIDRMCWLEELTLRGGNAGAMEEELG